MTSSIRTSLSRKKAPVTFKRIWGRLVFRYAGRNVCAHNPVRSRQFYNLIGRFYDWIYTEHIEGYQQSLDYLAQHCISPGDSVLDVGCGTGALIDKVADQAGLVVGFDLSRTMLMQAKERTRENSQVYFVAGDCRYLPLQGQFDKIVSSFMLVILRRSERKAVIAELARLLKPGGEMVFLTAQDDISPQWLTRQEWTWYCQSAGMNRVEIVDIFDYFRLVRASSVPANCGNQDNRTNFER